MQLDRARDGRPGPAVTAAELAWLAAAPCAFVAALAVVVLGPPLGHALLEPSSTHFWRYDLPLVIPEPVERARYLLAVLGPLLLVGCVAVLARRTRRRPARAAAGVLGSQALVVAFVAVCVVVQQVKLFGLVYSNLVPQHRAYFTHTTLIVAALLAVLIAAAAGARPIAALGARLRRETPIWRVLGGVLAGALALALTATWLLTAYNTEASIGATNPLVYPNFPLITDEAFAVLDGRYPLVDFHAMYGHLWLYVAALAMNVLGASFGVYGTTMLVGSGAILLALFATLRRIVRSSLLALALYAPVLATGFFIELGPPEFRYAPSNLFSLFPMRYGGPYVLAWLTARHIDGARPRRRMLLFAGAGIVLLNNVEFGLPALGATLAAILLSAPQRSRALLARLAIDVTGGLLAAVALIAALTLSLAGSLPHLGTLLTVPRLYGIDGFTMLPMPTLGFHLAIYVTFAAALVLATVRALRGDEDRVLTGMLAWAGVFGLGAGAYYAGRSHPEVLIAIFSAWAFAIAVLCVAVVRAIAARSSRWPQPAELAVLFGFGLTICSLAQFPPPRPQLERIRHGTTEPILLPTAQEQFVARRTRLHETVAIFAPLGHRIAYDTGIHDTVTYGGLEVMPAHEQWDEAIAAVRAAGGRKLFVSLHDVQKEAVVAIKQMGFTRTAQDPATTLTEFVAPR